MLDEPASGLRMLQEGLMWSAEIGTLEDFPLYECLAAEATAQVGRCDDAIEALERARASFAKLGLYFWRPEVLRLLAELRLVTGVGGAAKEIELLLGEAAALADAQGVVMLGLRIAVNQTELAVRLGDSASGVHHRLSQALKRIAEPDASPDLLMARSMMGRLVDGEGFSTRCRAFHSHA